MVVNLNNIAKDIIGRVLMNTTYAIYSCARKSCVGRGFEHLHSKLMQWGGLSYLPILNAEKYQQLTHNVQLTTVSSERQGLACHPVYAGEQLTPQVHIDKLPDLRLHLYSNVCITGDSDVIVDVKNNCVISDFCYDIDPGLMFVDGLLYRDKHNLCILRSNLKQKTMSLDSGIMISGKFSGNYYHTLLENLSRLVLLDEFDIPVEVPILVDESVSKVPSFKRIFEILTKNQHRNVVFLEKGKLYELKSLYYLDHINKISPHVKDLNVMKDDYVLFDAERMKKLRNLLLENMSDAKFPKRILLSRKHTSYRRFNDDELMTVLRNYGFEQVFPEDYSFEEQMGLFNNAEWIVGGTGAAFTNALFCSEGCNILIFNSVPQKIDMPYFSTLAYLSNAAMTYFLPSKSKSSKSVHTDCTIDINDFQTYLKALL